MKCPHCKFISETFKDIDNNFEYWLLTEIFVYLHNGKDYCDYEESITNNIPTI